MVSWDAQAACEFVRSKSLSNGPYSRFSDCGYAADNRAGDAAGEPLAPIDQKA